MSGPEKLRTFDELVSLADELRRSSRRIVLCHGVFDLLHIGHIRYLEKARRLGDILMVTVTPDRFVNKGPHRPVFEERLRADAVAALECVDYVAVNRWPTAVETIRALKPAVYAKGGEFRDRKTPELEAEEKAVAECGGQVEFIEEITSSSSKLINQYLSPFPQEVSHYLRQLRQRFTSEDVLRVLREARPLRALVVGEAVLDEDVTCATLDRSPKAPVLAARYEGHERFAGGALAVANHMAAFCDEVRLVAMIGRNDSHEAWIREHLAPNVVATFFAKPDAPTVLRQRFRESYFGVPLFELMFLDQRPLERVAVRELCGILDAQTAACDVVVASDYGYTMLAPEAVDLLCRQARFLCVSTQANAANIGLHTVSRYPRADYVALAERELRLDCRQPTGELDGLLAEMARRLRTKVSAVTVGKHGCLCYTEDEGVVHVPALATRVVDRIGAGDAFFAITSLAAAVGTSPEILAFLGNVAAAEAVSVVGYEPLEWLRLERHIESLFK